MIKLLTSAFFILISITISAQINEIAYIPKTQEGSLIVQQSEETAKIIDLYTLKKQSDKGIKGYTINIFSDSNQGSKEGALKARARFINRFDDVKVDIRFNSPFYRVYVGKFYTKTEARKFLGEMLYLFPNAYIVPEYYDIPDSIE
jgi:hypothetical protein